jgi:hypothetical protein
MTTEFDPTLFPTIDVPAIWNYAPPPEAGDGLIYYAEDQAKNGLIATADIFESILRLLIGYTDIKAEFDPPEGYDPEIQGEWDPSIKTFMFSRKI